MSDLPPEKKLRITELKMTETKAITLTANELNRFSRQNAALGNSRLLSPYLKISISSASAVDYLQVPRPLQSSLK